MGDPAHGQLLNHVTNQPYFSSTSQGASSFHKIESPLVDISIPSFEYSLIAEVITPIWFMFVQVVTYALYISITCK